jgi:hypothetical protein
MNGFRKPSDFILMSHPKEFPMKAMSAFFTLFLMSATPLFAAEKQGHDHKPLHGGVVTEAKDVDYELVIKPDVIDIHIRDHGKPIDLTGATAVLTLLVGTEKQEIKLAAAGTKFTVNGKFSAPAGTKAVALITLRGKPAKSVRFTLK